MRYSEEFKDKIKNFSSQGYTQRSIARLLNISRHTVGYILNYNNGIADCLFCKSHKTTLSHVKIGILEENVLRFKLSVVLVTLEVL